MEELRRQEKQVVEGVSWRLISRARLALDALRDCVEHPEGRGQNVKRLAAVSILELVLKWREQVDFEERLSRLERQVFSE